MATQKANNDQSRNDALERLIQILEAEVPPLLAEKKNFKIVINGSGGGTLKVEVTKYLDA